MARPVVGIVCGSESDTKTMKECGKVLAHFGIAAEESVISAHRSPVRAREYAESARERGIKVIIAGAGMAAHLAGAMASATTLPVIGVPLETQMEGLDSLLSTVQMPSGIPVATVSVGKAGARNAAILAAEILALGDENLGRKLTAFRNKLAKQPWNKIKMGGSSSRGTRS